MRYRGNRLVLAMAALFGCIVGAIAVPVAVGLFAIFNETSVNFLPFYEIAFNEGGLILTMQWAYWLVFLVAFLVLGMLAFLVRRSDRHGREHRVN